MMNFSSSLVESSGTPLCITQRREFSAEEEEGGLIDCSSAKYEVVASDLVEDLHGALVGGSLGPTNNQTYSILQIDGKIDDKVVSKDEGTFCPLDADEGVHLHEGENDTPWISSEQPIHGKSRTVSFVSIVFCTMFIQRVIKGRHATQLFKWKGSRSEEPVSIRKSADLLFPDRQADFPSIILGFPLGFAIGSVFAEVLLNGECDISLDQLTKLLDAALLESLCPVLGDKHEGFANTFKGSFRSAFKTIVAIREMHGFKVNGNCATCRSRKFENASYDRKQNEHGVVLNSVSSRRIGGEMKVQSSSSNNEARKALTNADEEEEESCVDRSCLEQEAGVVLNSISSRRADGKMRVESSSPNDEARKALANVDDQEEELCIDQSCLEQEACSTWVGAHMNGKDESDLHPNLPYNEIGENNSAEMPLIVPSNPPYNEIRESNSSEMPLVVSQFDNAIVASSLNLHGDMGENFKVSLLSVFKQSVEAQERYNHIKSMALEQKMKRISLKEDLLGLSSESNELMRENLLLSRDKVNFKEKESRECWSNAAYTELRQCCADELAAGLIIMLVSLFYGARWYSYDLISHKIASTCQPPEKEVSKSWWQFSPLSKSLDLISTHVVTLLCWIYVMGRMLAGLAFAMLMMWLILRRAGSSQSMPTTVIIIILGGVCGLTGNFAVTGLGGNGTYWLALWEIFCILHALAACFPSFVCYLLTGSSVRLPGNHPKLLVPAWFRSLVFHSLLVLILPVFSGLLPFAPFNIVTQDLLDIFVDTLVNPFLVYVKVFF